MDGNEQSPLWELINTSISLNERKVDRFLTFHGLIVATVFSFLPTFVDLTGRSFNIDLAILSNPIKAWNL